MVDSGHLLESGGERRAANSNNAVYSIDTLLRFYKPLDIPKNIYKLENFEHRTNYNASKWGSTNVNSKHSPNYCSNTDSYYYRRGGHFASKYKQYGRNCWVKPEQGKLSTSQSDNFDRSSWRDYNGKTPNVCFNRTSFSKSSNASQAALNSKFETEKDGFFEREAKGSCNYHSSSTNKNTSFTDTETGSEHRVLGSNHIHGKYLRSGPKVVNDDQHSGNICDGVVHLNENIIGELTGNRNTQCEESETTKDVFGNDMNNSGSVDVVGGNRSDSGCTIHNNDDLTSINESECEIGALNSNGDGELGSISGGIYISGEDAFNLTDTSVRDITNDDDDHVGLGCRKDEHRGVGAFNCDSENSFPMFSSQAENDDANFVSDSVDILDRPFWFFKEIDSTIVHGPHSTREMGCLFDNCEVTENMLFSLVSNRSWFSLNTFYPNVTSFFKYFPSEFLEKDLATSVDNLEDKKGMNKVVAKISELDVEVEKEKEDSNLVSNAEGTAGDHTLRNLISLQGTERTTHEDRTDKRDFRDAETDRSFCKSYLIYDDDNPLEVDNSVNVQSRTKKQVWKVLNDDKKETINFEDILREEERNSLKCSTQKVNNEQHKMGVDGAANAIRGWKKINTDNNVQPLNPYGSLSEVSNASLGSATRNKWKGWGGNGGASATVNLDQGESHGFWDQCKANSSKTGRSCDSRGGECSQSVIVENAASVEAKLANQGNLVKPPVSNVSKNRKKKGVKVDSSLLAFGIRSDRPRNLNYDFD